MHEHILNLNSAFTPVAYLDGGTGSMLLQAAMAGILTAAYLVKSQWAAITAKIRRGNKLDAE